MKRLNTINIEHGTEGCRHDPYGFEVISFTGLDGVTHSYKSSGLEYSNYMVDGKLAAHMYNGAGYDECRDRWEAATGLTLARASKIFDRQYIEDPMGDASQYI